MIVSEENLQETVKSLAQKPRLALDTETFGLAWEDKMFSLIIGDSDEQFYFNFLSQPDHLGAPPPVVLDKSDVFETLKDLFSREDILWFMHNSKFDLQRLGLEGSSINGVVHDTEVVARILRNDHMGYSLEEVAARYGFEKDPKVEEYITEHGLYTQVQIPGKKKRDKLKHFNLVPFPIIYPYGCRDVEVTYKVGVRQLNELGL